MKSLKQISSNGQSQGWKKRNLSSQKKRRNAWAIEKRKRASIEADIEAIENRIAEIEGRWMKRLDFGKLSAQKELIEENERLLEKYDRYEYLSELDE